jgi:ABC-2 type transport system ATP-binding protein
MSSILSINNLSKAYGSIKALKDVSFSVPEGSVFGILGPNGSGKTTMLGVILDILIADGGTYAWFGGEQPEEARKKIGSLLETPNFYHYMSAYDNLAITAALRGYGHEDRLRVLGQVGLLERKDSKFSAFSLGMKQRLAIGAALLGSPKVLVFDEPTNGLDPQGIAEIRELIKSLNKQGFTIIIASHMLDEIEKVCTHMAILKKGTLLITGHVSEVLQSNDQVEIASADLNSLQILLTRMPGITQVSQNGNTLLLTGGDAMSTYDINKYCIDNGVVLTHLILKKKSLESRFMEITS